MFSNSNIGLLLFITHFLSAIVVGIILGLISRFSHNVSKANITSVTSQVSSNEICTFNNLGAILANAILESSKTIIMIGGFVVIFSVILSILENSKILEVFSYPLYVPLKFLHINTSFAKPLISGIIELTNGVSLVSSIANKSLSCNIILCAFLLGFGGISVLLQVLSITSKSDLSIKKYIFGKILQGIIAAFFTYVLISLIPIFYLNL